MRHRPTLAILVVAVLLLAAWRVVIGVRPQPAEFGESNYQANRIRIERYLRRSRAPAWVLLGSSLSGRLPAEAFAGTALADIEVLGLDGSTPLIGMAVLTNRTDRPRVVLVETFTFNRGWKTNDQLLLDGLRSPGMTLARADPLFAAEQRPSSLLYSWLKAGRGPSVNLTSPTTNAAVRLPGPADPAGVAPAAVLDPLRAGLRAVQAAGMEVVLVDLLAGERQAPGARPGPDTAQALADELGLRRLDLRAEWFARGWVPTYTDARHLDAGSAAAAARLLAEVLSRPKGGDGK
jgi:hypothetical protein